MIVNRRQQAEQLFIRADKEYDAGNFKSSFRLMVAAAKLGHIGAQLDVGNYFDDGAGVRRNGKAALCWYMRAYRRGCAIAASNIGVHWRNENQQIRALQWFFRAVRLGDVETNLEIGKHYLNVEKQARKSIPYLTRVSKSTRVVTEAGAEEAARLLAKAKKMVKAPNSKSQIANHKSLNHKFIESRSLHGRYHAPEKT